MSLPCAAVGGCSNPAAVVWTRRPTAAELVEIAATQPEYAPPPTEDTVTVPVYACTVHAISMDLAAHVHESICTAPNPPDLPGCNCTPEPLPDDPDPQDVTAATVLPDHWQPPNA
ncbi:hypothetical protein [Streptantibioticus silvisoli]|uniref:Ig-like domain-containing protein n=1 Tax=Streptantibioticus silvisoli TaxID=2705255 RepID=A0ABT6W4N0_9ACTN|nr:hypothetical protein [Streptantibioticus silvisoli]MDI5965711.1 hypothetical protein [Streptantibioticus silvisoli]